MFLIYPAIGINRTIFDISTQNVCLHASLHHLGFHHYPSIPVIVWMSVFPGFASVTLPALLQSSLLAIFLHQDGVTIGLEVLLPKDAKLHSESRPPLEYDVFLYKVVNNGDSASPSQAPPIHSTDIYSTSHPIAKSPKSPKTHKSPKVPKSPKSPKHGKEQPPSNHKPLSGRHSSPSRHPSPGRHPSLSRHSAPGCYSSPTCHPSSHHSSSQYKCMLTSTPPQLRQPPGSERSGTGRECQGGHIRPSPSSPHLTQPPPSPSKVKYSPVSTRSLPPLSWPGL